MTLPDLCVGGENDMCSASMWSSASIPSTCRFECCSSDAMSVGQTSSSAVMEVSSSSQSGSPFPSTLLSGPTGFVRHPGVPSNCSNLSVTTNTRSISSTTPTSQSLTEHSGGGIAKDLSESYMVESLRWEKQYSDEEKETERIEEWDEKLGEGGEGRGGLYNVISWWYAPHPNFYTTLGHISAICSHKMFHVRWWQLRS